MPSSETFCTIMSTLILAAASGPKIEAATPGLSSIWRTEICASSLEKAMPVTTWFSMISSSPQISVPGGWLACGSISSGLSKLERTKIGMLYTMPSSTERTWSTLAPWDASSSMSSKVILSRRSCAETCSAMVSRSRLNKTRGPPDALRMCCDPPPQSQPTGSPVAAVKRTKNNNFSHSAPPQTSKPAESAWLKLSHSLRQPPHQAV